MLARLLVVVAACLGAACPGAGADTLVVASPRGRVEFRLMKLGGTQLGFAVALRGRAVIEPSPLGILVDGVNLAERAEFSAPERYRVRETYPWHGAHTPVLDDCRGARIPIRHAPTGQRWTLEVRAYDDGVAFRFLVPSVGMALRVPDEATAFRLPAGSTLWYHDFEGHYEGVHQRKRIEEVAPGEWAAPPVTFRLPGNQGYGSITEGALLRYSGMGLQADGRGALAARLGHTIPPSYPFRLRYPGDIERMARPAAIAGPITTPWRIVMAATDLDALVNCDIVHNVAPPPDPNLFPQGAATPWIRPGRAVWRYLDGGEATPDGVKEFSRLAAELGFEYQVVEGFWQKWPAEVLREVIGYSRERGVGLWLWKHSRELRDPIERRKFFRLASEAGAAGVKLDFYDHEAKEVVELYEASLREAAEFRLLVNFHGANKPTGESRTFPNELTREAVRGMEARNIARARHDATLPFTRLLAGHADYTPVHFGARRNDTTVAHQLATAVVFTSPLLTFAAHPRSLLASPAVDLIKSIPSVWDETRVLPPSEIGEIAILARRRGPVWFLAAVNGPAPRRLEVPLNFLGGGVYRVLLARDHPGDPAALEVEHREARREQTLSVELLAGGGCLARFSR
ncbi:MAG: glycoside hydrolase family 97 catalytic domain-containing protein [Bryobacterales bacterium]|nr:glycoside hydrolase family 97 protein [Bryobacteraceae bacterium]MDW8129655.1 glycoside hydrolase family 97 catalytic domain-containing protein [Bryobacterales bacterium]